MDAITLIIGILVGFFIGFFMMKISSLHEHKNIRKSAIRGSKNNILGEVYEKILPAMPSFPYKPKDMTFVGKWCDYIIFDGLSSGDLREIIFLELKSGKSRLNKNEKMIKAALDAKRVRFAEYRIDSIKS